MSSKEKLKELMEANMYETTVVINGYEYEFKFSYDFISEEKGAWCDGVQVDPDIPAYIQVGRQEILIDNDWQDVDLPDESLTDSVNEIMEEMRG